jgi:hypothetical protein
MIGGRLRTARSATPTPPAPTAISIPSSQPGASWPCRRVGRDVRAPGVTAARRPAARGRSPLTGKERVLSPALRAAACGVEASAGRTAPRPAAGEGATSARSRPLAPNDGEGSAGPLESPRCCAAARRVPAEAVSVDGTGCAGAAPASAGALLPAAASSTGGALIGSVGSVTGDASAASATAASAAATASVGSTPRVGAGGAGAGAVGSDGAGSATGGSEGTATAGAAAAASAGAAETASAGTVSALGSAGIAAASPGSPAGASAVAGIGSAAGASSAGCVAGSPPVAEAEALSTGTCAGPSGTASVGGSVTGASAVGAVETRGSTGGTDRAGRKPSGST